MSRSSIRRFTLAVLLVLLVAPWSSAAERRGPSSLKQPRVVSALAILNGLWAKIGCILDPNGNPLCATSFQWQTKEGCGIDPDGVRRCTPAPNPSSSIELGCGIDPDGCAGGK